MLHKVMVEHREFRQMEQHVLWKNLFMFRAALEDSHVVWKAPDLQCQATYGVKWWSWSWCRESHKKLLRFLAHDGPAAVNGKLLDLIEVRRGMQRHIVHGHKTAKEDEEPDKTNNIHIEVEHSEGYIEDLEKELDGAGDRLRARQDLTRRLQLAQAIPNVFWLKANVTKLIEEGVALTQAQLQETMKRSREFQIRTGQHLLGVVERKCARVQDHFYKGGSHDALVNKDAYEQVTSPVAHVFANATGGSGTKVALAPRAGSRTRLRRLVSRFHQELAEPWFA